MKPISVFGNLETEFTGNGLAVLELAKEVVIKQEINGSYELTFTLPSCSKWQHVKEENIVKCEDALFRIIQISGHNITARSVYYDAVYKHIQYLGDMIGMIPRDIMINIFDDTKIHVMTVSEVSELGMEWVTEPTDFFEVSKITPIGCMETLVKTLNSQKVNTELYIDNYNVALVKSMGKWRGARIDAQLNCSKNPEWQRDTQNIVTRLYPYGKDDLHIDSITTGARQYIDSPNIAKFGVKEGYVEFDEIEEPEELLQAAQWQFDENNLERVDAPKYAFEIDWIDISAAPGYEGRHTVDLGDTVEVHDRDFDVISKQRVIAIERHPYEPNKNKLTVGNPPQTLSQIMDNLIDGNAQYNKTTNGKGEVKTGWLEYMQGNETVSINNDLNSQDIALYKTGALWESPDGTSAVAIINGRVALSNSKRSGQWYWTTIADAGKIIVSEVFTGTLYTEFVKLMGEGAQLEISNNMITFRTPNGDIRSRWGYDDNGKYVFEMYAEDGTQTIGINSSGEIELVGTMYASHFVGTGKANYEAIESISGPIVTEVFAEMDRRGIKINQDKNGQRLQKIGMTVDGLGSAILVLGAGNGGNKTTINGVTYSNESFVVSKEDGVTYMGLWGNRFIYFYNDRIEIDGVNVRKRIEDLEDRVMALEDNMS